ncbi:MAG: hypothetical protein WAS72_06940 [Saprospiraceae bacterium]
MTRIEMLQSDIAILEKAKKLVMSTKFLQMDRGSILLAINKVIDDAEGRIGRQTDIFSMLQEVEHEN